MKVTDFSIIFISLFMVFYLIYSIGSLASGAAVFSSVELNAIMDEITVDAMNEGYRGVDDNLNPRVDRDELIRSFIRESSLIFEEKSLENYMPAFVKKIIYMQNNGYYVYFEGRWSSKILFNTEKHEEQVNMIIRSLTRAINNGLDAGIYEINIPTNYGEAFSQTVSEYSFLVLCEDSVFSMNGNEYCRYFLSGATLKSEI